MDYLLLIVKFKYTSSKAECIDYNYTKVGDEGKICLPLYFPMQRSFVDTGLCECVPQMR